ncbi:hypothetical protein [Bordetella hinzii]|uniref:hypothetical protein n=1 Tax=Bordetella hinzii TaxID=103855 RepID=UPI001F2AD244|nr:hypothetical protein [Bordetella hinzii]
MTQQDDITQRVLTDEECISILKFGSSSIAMARAVESAVLSKLRAPVADETQAPHDHDLWFQEYEQTLGAFHNSLTIHTRAAWVAASRQYAALASAPVAGEAVAWVSDTAGATDNPKLAETWRKMGWPVRPLVYGDAAPQGSAEPVSDAGTAASGDVVLPPLPFPAPRHIRAAQMKEYARAAVLADRQQRGGDVGEHGAFWWRKGLRATLAPQPAAPHSDLERARQGLPPYNPSMPTEQDWQRITENGRKAWGGAQPAASAEPSDEHLIETGCYQTVIERHSQPAASAEPAVWVAADTLNSPHPTCVSSLAYMSQLDRDRGREYVPLYAAPVAAQTADDARNAAFEAVRQHLCKLQRYSFIVGPRGGVRRVKDRVGNWIEFDAVHELFDPVAVDAAMAAEIGKNMEKA